MNDFLDYEPSEKDLNENDTLYTDIVAQLVSAWFTSNTKIISSICESIADDINDNESGMPGILFGFMLHITTLLSKMATEQGISIAEAWSNYLNDYNTGIRQKMSLIPILHPKIADELSRKFLNDDEQD